MIYIVYTFRKVYKHWEFIVLMRRKVVKQGSSTFTISLPARWVRNFGISAGDEIDVEEKGSELVMRAEGIKTPAKREIDVSGLDNSLIRRSIISLYVKGVEEIKVSFSDKKAMDILQNLTLSLLGFAVIEQGKDYCIIREVSREKQEEFDALLKKLFFTLHSLGNDIIEKTEGKEISKIKELKELEHYGMNRTAYLCMRILNKYGYKEQDKITLLYELVRFLENTGDEYWRICEQLIDSNGKARKDTLQVFGGVNEIILELYFGLFKPDKKRVNEIYIKTKKIRKEKLNEMIRKNVRDTLLLCSIGKVAELISYIIETEMVLLA
jgi:phosphate uptake regulator